MRYLGVLCEAHKNYEKSIRYFPHSDILRNMLTKQNTADWSLHHRRWKILLFLKFKSFPSLEDRFTSRQAYCDKLTFLPSGYHSSQSSDH